ncbi:TnsA endonuclease N-terminal domain-containing protein [Alishewanella sp. HL-SH06]|uniref:TnsA endonuclease N-terminal domain-containing protein n=1 Tax=Alishewanella sp. HL-SH06 TaxID=3461144 RepID=UPI0040434941
MLDSEKPLHPFDEKLLKTRGLGSGRQYEPFIKVHEISSTGESFRIFGRHSFRIHHLLSRIELSAFLIFDCYKFTIDIKEQFPLPIVDTISICKHLGIKHPQIAGKLKVVTTDLVIELKNKPKLAIAVKRSEELQDPRVLEKLQIEKYFWEQQGHQWKLFTEFEISASLKENLQWIHAASQNLDEIYTELSDLDIPLVFQRLAGSNIRLTTRCAALDDEYSCEPGFHIGFFRKVIAANYLSVPLDKVFSKWSCSELILVEDVGILAEGISSVS